MNFTPNHRLIHIATDEKFINSAYLQFEQVLPGQNIFYILVKDINPKHLKYIRLEDNMILIKSDLVSIKKLLKTIQGYTHFVFHGLDYTSSVIFNRLPKQSLRYWILFGKEFYSNPYIFKSSSLLGNKTRLLYNNKRSNSKFFKNIFRNTYYNFKNKTKSPGLEVKKAMESADFLGILYKEEFDLIKSKIKNQKLKYLKFSYYPIENMLNNVDATVSGYNILLGNSASYSNNHLESFDLLSNINLNDKKVICPLSYGDKEYARLIQAEGELKLKNSFEALIDFMPLHQYNQHLEKCGFVIMNHYRQQAVGNVMVMLWMGAKVFLDERNSLYSYLKRLNVNVYNIKEDLNEKELNNLLSNDQREHNRHILIKEVGKERLNLELHSVFKSLKR